MALARDNLGDLTVLYERDYALWIAATLGRLRDRDFEDNSSAYHWLGSSIDID